MQDFKGMCQYSTRMRQTLLFFIHHLNKGEIITNYTFLIPDLIHCVHPITVHLNSFNLASVGLLSDKGMVCECLCVGSQNFASCDSFDHMH